MRPPGPLTVLFRHDPQRPRRSTFGQPFSQLTHRDAEFAVKAILDAMGEALVKGHRIEIRGFGSFSVNRRSPRIGRNPRSGESVMIPEKRVPHFKPGKALREAGGQAKTAEILGREPKKPDLIATIVPTTEGTI